MLWPTSNASRLPSAAMRELSSAARLSMPRRQS